MSGSFGVRGTVRPTAGRPAVRTAPLVGIGVFISAVVLIGLIAFFRGA